MIPKHILCAVRGAPESRSTVTRAIDLALEHGARLTFFHAVDAEFLAYATVGPLSIVHKELHELGKFVTLILCDRARRRGVEHVDDIVREGNIKKLLREIAIETGAELMVMGRPVRSPGSNVFKEDEFDGFVALLEREGGLKIEVVTHSA
jgi:nucleotide-binding universal stress UspA family protein